MRIGKVIGTVTLIEPHPTFRGATLKAVVPLSLDDLVNPGSPQAEPLIVYDELGAGIGGLIAFSEGGEAAQPFGDNRKPVDAYNAALLDAVHVRSLPE
jgi:ethanolamine utilization protein EutN